MRVATRIAGGELAGQISRAAMYHHPGFAQPAETFCVSAAELVEWRRMKITEILMAEHAVFHNLFDHIEATAPRARTLAEVKSLAVIMEKLMAPHSQTEDALFIEPLEHCFDQLGQGETFHDEHEMIDEMLGKVHKARDLKASKKILLSAVAASRKHFDKEERIVFPLAERVLKTKTLSELGTQWFAKRDAKSR